MHRKASRRLWRALLATVALALAAGLAACGGSSGSSAGSGSGGTAAKAIDHLTVVVPVQADALDTTKASVGSLGVLLLGLEPLTLYDPATGSFKPNLATSFRQDDPLTYRYTLRQGVKFWNGTPLTADDVVFSFDLHRGKGNASFIAQQWAGVASVRKTGADGIEIKLSAPNPQFPFAIAGTGIVSKAYYEAHRKQIGSPEVLNMGTGPYRFTSFKPSAETTLVRNERYWGPKPPVKRLDVRTIADDSQRLLAVQSGAVDGVVGIPLAQLPSFRHVPSFALSSGVDYSIYKFNFDLDKKPWGDVHLRRAFAYAIDRDAIANQLFEGNAEPAVTLVPPSVMAQIMPRAAVDAAYARIAASEPGFDLAAARRELAQSSTPHGITTTLLVTGSDPNLAAMAQVAAQDLAKVGIHLQIKQVDDNTYYNAVYFRHTTDGVSLENFGTDGPDPSNIPSNALDSANAYPQGSGVDVSDYRNPQVDRLLAQSRQLRQDDPKRGQLLIDAEALAAKDTPYVTLFYPRIYLGLKQGLRWPGFSTFWWLSRWPDDVSAGS